MFVKLITPEFLLFLVLIYLINQISTALQSMCWWWWWWLSGFSIGCHEAPVEKCLKITVNIMSAIIQVSAVVLPPPRTAAERRKIFGKLEKIFST